MPSVLRQLQAEWNTLVPQAQAMGIRRVRLLREPVEVNGPLESIAYRRAKLEWLKAQIGTYDEVFSTWTFGPEIECCLPRSWTDQRLAEQIKAQGVDCRVEHLHHETRTWWRITNDGSLRGVNGAELVAPILRGQDGFDQVAKVTKVLTDINTRVNRSCGLHVHVGVKREFEAGDVGFFRRLVTMYAHAEDVIDSFMAPSRRGDSAGFARSLKRRINWTKLAEAQTIDDVVKAVGQIPGRGRHGIHGTRYSKMNLEALFAYKTVEFRQHQGTVEGNKAINWIKFLLRMCSAARVPEDKVVDDFDRLADAIRMSQHEKAFFAGRITEFRTREGRV